jgi:hypothetical protein
LAGKRFEQLTEEQQNQIKFFPFPVETFHGITDEQVLEIFCRLNMNGIPLNKQELRNGKFYGSFKQVALKLSLRYLEFWRKHKIFTEIAIARMLEVELTSELLIAGNSGMQDKKSTIDDFYDKWELSYPDEQRDQTRFADTLSAISDTFTDKDLGTSAFRRPPLFYTLYCAVYHHIFGMPGVQRSTPKKHLTADTRESLREAVINLSDVITQSKEPEFEVPKRYVKFVAAYKRQTDNIHPRKIRFDTLFDEAF